MRCLVAALMLVALSLDTAEAKKVRSPKRTKVTVEASRPSSPFDCDTAKAMEWYGSERRCREDLCRGRNQTNAYVDAPDGRLRKNPCDHRVHE